MTMSFHNEKDEHYQFNNGVGLAIITSGAGLLLGCAASFRPGHSIMLNKHDEMEIKSRKRCYQFGELLGLYCDVLVHRHDAFVKVNGRPVGSDDRQFEANALLRLEEIEQIREMSEWAKTCMWITVG